MTGKERIAVTIHARYVHTNLIARDWRTLARFYCELFGCLPVPPERDLSGPEMDGGTGIQGAHLLGMHLRLPGHGETGPTLEIFSYDPPAERLPAAVNRPGYGHVAFSVDDVAAAQEAVLAWGGAPIGEIVSVRVGAGRVTWCYVTDPEGNALELQQWEG
jgi:catechol 2,3-dioxygenase-like lactoylglutathione lyase family enzyme